MKITVIVPIYNVENYLEKCINSILNQSFTDFELILVDDCSTDCSERICDEYKQKDNRIVVIHKENGGVSSARNAGLDFARGEYITFCDGDDYVDSDWLKNMIDVYSETNIDLLVSGFKVVDNSGNLLNSYRFQKSSVLFDDEVKRINFILNALLGVPCSVCTRMYKHSIILNNQIRFCETCDDFAEDMGFNIEYLLYCQNVSFLNNDDYMYVQRKTSKMHITQLEVMLNSVNEVSMQFLKRYDNQMNDKYSKKMSSVIFFYIIYNQLRRIIYSEKIKFLDKEIKKIHNRKWFNKQMVGVCKSFFPLKSILDEDKSIRIILLCFYCLHKNWLLYHLMLRIYTKFFGPSDASFLLLGDI